LPTVKAGNGALFVDEKDQEDFGNDIYYDQYHPGGGQVTTHGRLTFDAFHRTGQFAFY
jgi:hypothetical protein